jgi:hypothetical protein
MAHESLGMWRKTSVLAVVLVTTMALGSTLCAQDAGAEADLKSGTAELEKAAKQPDVQEELEEPDGVSLDDLDAENWKIFAIGTGTYEFNDAEEKKDAVAEAIMEAKASLAKFMKERLSTESQLDILAERESKKAKENGATVTSASTKRMKTSLTSIKNSADEILSGVITLETTMKWNGDSGEVRVKIAQSEKTLAAAKRFKERTRASAAAAEGHKPESAGQKPAGLKDGPSTVKQKSKSAL